MNKVSFPNPDRLHVKYSFSQPREEKMFENVDDGRMDDWVYHIWVWRPSRSCDPDPVNKVSFPNPNRLHVKYSFSQPREEKMFENVDDGRMDDWVYHIWVWRPSRSCDPDPVKKVSFPNPDRLHVKYSFSQPREEKMFENVDDGRMDDWVYHIWVWRPSRSCDPDPVNKVSFPNPNRLHVKYSFSQPRGEKMFENVDDGRMDDWVYHIWVWRPSRSCDPDPVNKVSFPNPNRLHVKYSFSQPREEKMFENVDDGRMDDWVYHIWVWRPSRSCDPDPVNKVSFPNPNRLHVKYGFSQPREEKMFENVDDGRMDDWVYHIWVWRPSRSCDPDPVNKVSFPNPNRLLVKYSFSQPREEKMFENVDDGRMDDWVYHIWVWRPSRSCDPDPVNKVSFPNPNRLHVKYGFSQPREEKMFENVDDGRMDDWVYHIWVWRPSRSCDPDPVNKVSFPNPDRLHVKYGFSQPREEKMFENVDDGWMDDWVPGFTTSPPLSLKAQVS